MSNKIMQTAFPVVHPPVDGLTAGGVEYYGMTLRDYFAAKVLVASLINDKENHTAIESHAGWAYEMADAMMEAREV